VDNRERQLTLQRQQQELVQRGVPQFLSAVGGPLPGGPGGLNDSFRGGPPPLAGPPLSPLLGRMEARPPPPPMAVAGVDTNHDGRPNYIYVGEDRNRDGIPDALQARPPAPMATVGIESNYDGRPNYFFTGADRNLDGIPDALQGRPPMQLPPRSGSPMPGVY
jgi:hypothetical protein